MGSQSLTYLGGNSSPHKQCNERIAELEAENNRQHQDYTGLLSRYDILLRELAEAKLSVTALRDENQGLRTRLDEVINVAQEAGRERDELRTELARSTMEAA